MMHVNFRPTVEGNYTESLRHLDAQDSQDSAAGFGCSPTSQCMDDGVVDEYESSAAADHEEEFDPWPVGE